ncbi:hypothetical protein LUZ60_016145 [Juncus effusus]|nr:hypothetical protein LUZ60_016145 [Juncus effusus]
MSYAAFKMMHYPTGIETCAAGFITSAGAAGGAVPNLVVTAANVLEVYAVRAQEERTEEQGGGGGDRGLMDGVSSARLDLICHYRLHGNVESIAVLSGSENRNSNKRDSIVLTFRDAKITVLEFDDSLHSLRTTSMHCFEGPDWQYLKRGRESFSVGPTVKADPQGRVAGVLIYNLQMLILKSAQASLVGEEEMKSTAGKSSVRVESSYIINLHELEINHVKDFIFVHGYIEPVLVILHEKEPTWAGRLAWKNNTCMVSALSINSTLKQHPLIWSTSNLPHDAYKLLAVPPPLGGVLVISANAIYYHSQSGSCSLALNSFSSQPDGSLEMPKSNFPIELDAANATWVSSDVALIISKTGELLLLTVVNDGRAVQRLDLAKSKASVLTSCMATLGNSFFFLGSRLGDSLLVQYSSNSTQITDEGGDMEMDNNNPFAKRLKRMPSDPLLDVTSGEELSLFTTAQNSSDSSQKSFSFVVRDSLLNIGPIKDFAYGLRINADPNATGLAKQSNYELVCCSGHGKNGALTVLQQSIRPELITEVELAGCKGIWTVYHKNSRDASKSIPDDEEYHSYLIISLENRTMVLETADDLGEVTETVDYYVHGSTIAAGNLFGRRRVVQIYGRGARVLDGSYMTQELIFSQHISEPPAGVNSEPPAVAFVSIADPYVLLRMTDGSIHLLIGDSATCTISLSTPQIFSTSNSSEKVTACTLYSDAGPHTWLKSTSSDAWLTNPTDSSDASPTASAADVYCLVCYETGRMEIYEIPGFKPVFTVNNFISGNTLLTDGLNSQNDESVKKEEDGLNLRVVEIVMHKWPGRHSKPYLFGVLNDGTLLSYRAYFYEKAADVSGDITTDVTDDVSRLRNLRFVRIQTDTNTREDEETSGNINKGRNRISVFNNVGGYQGLFVSGSRPVWMMVCRNRIRPHPQFCDGPVVAFTVLHNVNCNHGLIYVTSQGFLKICQLPAGLNYDNYWPARKIPLHGTPHQVTYHTEKNLYPVIVSVPVIRPLNQVLQSMSDQESAQQIEINPDDMQKTYSIEEFEIRVLELEKSSSRWETKATIPMQNFEHALTVRIVTLHNTSTKENETLMAVGTAFVQGEDVPSRGRILLFSFSNNNESSQNLVTEVFSKELKGAVSALAPLQGHLLLASGPKITLNKWTGSDLIGVAFYDAPLHVVSLNIVKNFVLLGDIHKSVFFLNWKEQGAQLSMLAKDFSPLDCFATEFLIDGSTLSLVVADAQKNLQIMYYAPKQMESWKGQKLLPRTEFHTGSHITKFLRLQTLSADKSGKFALLFSTLDGSLGCVAPVEETAFKRLQQVQKKLVEAVPHVCGLNPRAFRQFRSEGRPHKPGPDNMLDFELINYYEMLSLEEQKEIAEQIKSTRSQILTNFSELIVGTSFL